VISTRCLFLEFIANSKNTFYTETHDQITIDHSNHTQNYFSHLDEVHRNIVQLEMTINSAVKNQNL